MNLSDVRTGYNEYDVAVDTASTPLCGPNPNRIALIVSSPAANRYTISTRPTAVLGSGITLYAADPPLFLERAKIGTAIQGALSAIFDTAGETVTVIEILKAP